MFIFQAHSNKSSYCTLHRPGQHVMLRHWRVMDSAYPLPQYGSGLSVTDKQLIVGGGAVVSAAFTLDISIICCLPAPVNTHKLLFVSHHATVAILGL